ncbi:MAG TPA: hypothetical protein VMU83_06640, partial [Hanamia sp.]|nr:hypothetical protein [Hanamia sp.]
SAQASHGTVRESLLSYGSCYPIMLLLPIANDRTIQDLLPVSDDTFYIAFPCCVFYMCSLSIYVSVHSNNKIHRMLHRD